MNDNNELILKKRVNPQKTGRSSYLDNLLRCKAFSEPDSRDRPDPRWPDSGWSRCGYVFGFLFRSSSNRRTTRTSLTNRRQLKNRQKSYIKTKILILVFLRNDFLSLGQNYFEDTRPLFTNFIITTSFENVSFDFSCKSIWHLRVWHSFEALKKFKYFSFVYSECFLNLPLNQNYMCLNF